jgi:Zn-dependent M28 family amino/carboxypeptidase
MTYGHRRWLLAGKILLSGILLLMTRYDVLCMSGPSSREKLSFIADEGDLAVRLEKHVRVLGGEIGERNLWRPGSLEAAASYVEREFHNLGFPVAAQEYVVEGKTVRNLEVEIEGVAEPGEIILVGAHYDSAPGSPGANDNATGVAALIEIARMLAKKPLDRTVRFVGFVNEEPPLFMTERMGSLRYARRARQRGDNIVGMLSLETIGYYRQEKGTQSYPNLLLRPFYPSRGNFIAFVGNVSSRSLLRRCLASFRRGSDFPSAGLSAPGWVTGVDWSDHWSFWQEGYPAIMVTDTAVFRYPWYHSSGDTPEKVNYPAMARVTAGLAGMVADVARR